MFSEYNDFKITNSPNKLVIFLHGVGSNGQDLIDLAPLFAEKFKNAYFISPNGLEKYDMAPFGYQWFSLKDRSVDAMSQGIAKSAPILAKNIEEKLLELGLSHKDLILVGFSQGTMMAIDFAFRAKEKICAVVGFSGTMVPSIDADELIAKNSASASGIENKTPVCLIHGTDDEVLSVDYMRKSVEFLKSQGFPVASLEIPNLRHSIDKSGVDFAIDFISKYY
jgi:phospholipase/carboxylesterase